MIVYGKHSHGVYPPLTLRLMIISRSISRGVYNGIGQLATRRFLTTNARQAFLRPLASHSGVVCLSLNRPETKNAISLKLLQELGECLDNVKFDKRYAYFNSLRE